MDDILKGYAADAADLIERFEAISSHEVFLPVLDLLPKSPTRVADVGAGTGRDAAWFAEQGHHVLAIEPVQELRTARMSRRQDSRIEWLDDRLPRLTMAQDRGLFELVTVGAVWQHLEEAVQGLAMTSLSQMIQTGGLLIMSLRHGPGATNRQVFQTSAETVINIASSCGFDLLRKVEAASVQSDNRSNGVRWTWLALRKTR
ncbi:class I SAM-dependent methyltransferase [Sphingopyxis fribergensis]|nr:class I SAM-dependent methyltransferase [Sphingopyxis fribergensis]